MSIHSVEFTGVAFTGDSSREMATTTTLDLDNGARGGNCSEFVWTCWNASKRIQTHPNVSERSRTGPGRFQQVPKTKKKLQNFQKHRKFCESFDAKLCLYHFHWTSIIKNRCYSCRLLTLKVTPAPAIKRFSQVRPGLVFVLHNEKKAYTQAK